MKKLNLLVIISMLAATVLAANPPGKLVQLEIINGSGDVIYMRLEGRITKAFYYLTIPRGATKTFTVLPDSYARTTWACGGVVSTGSLNMTGNVKLNFVLCGKFPVRTVWNDLNGDGIIDEYPDIFYSEIRQAPNFGEATQEKVVYFWSYTNNLWGKLCHYYTPSPCTWWWWDGVQWQSASLWVKIKLPFSKWVNTAFPRGKWMRYKYAALPPSGKTDPVESDGKIGGGRFTLKLGR